MVSELRSDDILYKLNILELLTKLAVKPHGMNYLVKHGAMNKFAEMIEDLQTNPLGGLLAPGKKRSKNNFFMTCWIKILFKSILEFSPIAFQSQSRLYQI